MTKGVKKGGVVLLLFFLLFMADPLIISSSTLAEGGRALVFFSSACSDCFEYIEGILVPELRKGGIEELAIKDYLNDRAARAELHEIYGRLGVPSGLQSHIAAFIDDRIVLAGHIPTPIIKGLLGEKEKKDFERILVFQDKMGTTPKVYKAWDFKGEIREYPIDTPIKVFFKDLKKVEFTGHGTRVMEGSGLLLPAVLSAGFLDGLNPCAFAVLLFLLAFLFTIRKLRADILKIGAIYLAAIYGTYFLIGLGILKALILTNQPHLMARIGAYLVIFLGLINLKTYLFPGLPLRLAIPHIGWERIKGWIYRATPPSTVVAGFLVGICTLPCSGGIYVATLGLLASKATYMKGLAYLALYNGAFILPLALILVATTNRLAAKRLAQWEREHTGLMRLGSGLAMVGLGLVILIWFV